MSCSHSSITDSFVRAAHVANVAVMPKQTQSWMCLHPVTVLGAWDPRFEI